MEANTKDTNVVICVIFYFAFNILSLNLQLKLWSKDSLNMDGYFVHNLLRIESNHENQPQHIFWIGEG